MSCAKRSRASAAATAAAAALLAVLLLMSNTVLADVITGDVTSSGKTYSGATHDLSQVTTYAYIRISSSKVSGSGLSIVGRSSPSSSDMGVSYAFSGGTMTAPVQFQQGIAANSDFVFSDSTVTMSSSASSAFVFATGTFTSNTSFTFTGITASWPSGATGSLVNVNAALVMPSKCGIFVESSVVANAASALILGSASGGASLASGSVVAVDQTNCANCGTGVAVVSGPLTLTGSSLFRVSLCDAGAKLLVRHAGTVAVSGSSLYTVTDSKSSGALFSYGASSFTVTGSSAVSFKNLTGSATGVLASSKMPTSVASGSYSYGDSACTFGSTAMSSTTTFANNGLNVNSFASSSTCTAAKCIPGGSSGASVSSGSCQCTCAAKTYQAYCTAMKDPLYAATGGSSACTLFKCTRCSVYTLNTCEECEAGYGLNSAKMCTLLCTEPHCAQCDANGDCIKCVTGYQLTSSKTCMSCQVPNCAHCSAADYCDQCETTHKYTLTSGQCILCEVPNCKKCSKTNYCDQCETTRKYTLTSGQCISCEVPNCAQCSAADYCDKCEATHKYTLTSGQCILCEVSNCAHCSAANYCDKCETTHKYTLTSGQCILCEVPNCKKCSKTNYCEDCETGYTRTSTGTCEPTKVDCDTGYYRASDGTCKPNCDVAGCLECSAPNTCSKCQPYLVASSDGKKCSCKADFCQTCDQTGCLICMPGYVLKSGGYCVRAPNGASSPLGTALVGLLPIAAALLACAL